MSAPRMSLLAYQRLQERVRASKRARTPHAAPNAHKPVLVRTAKNTPNSTEARYRREVLGCFPSALYEGVTLRLPGGSQYTPDWVTFDPATGRMMCHEVKGSYALASQSRAATAYRECVAAFPDIIFIWAKLEKSGRWAIQKDNEARVAER